MAPATARGPLRPARTAAICLALLMLYAALAWSAVRTKSATFDEPYHLVAAWTHLHWADYRVDPEDPPLWQLWATLPNGPRALHADPHSYFFNQILAHPETQFAWCVKVLFETADNDFEALLQQSRLMMLLIAVALGATLSIWAWQLSQALGLSSAVASIAATALFSFDPNFLAHGPLIKNDVVFTLGLTSLMWAVWKLGQRGTGLNLLAVLLTAALLPCVKFSGILAALLLPAALLTRAMLPTPWLVLGFTLKRRLSRLMAGGAVVLAAAAMGVILIWACYGFRFGASADPHERLNMTLIVGKAISNQVFAQTGVTPSQQQVDATAPPAFVRIMSWILNQHLLPEAWIVGLVYTYQSAIFRYAYLLGHIRPTGWWYYFPVAMAVKTPAATLMAAALAAAIIATRLRRWCPADFQPIWAACCLGWPVLLYGGWALTSNLNLGLRHILPIYPFGFLGIALAAAWSCSRWPRLAPPVAALLMLGLAAAAVSAFPDFIPFFNLFAGGSRGGLYLLGDSNLDWGQDLPLLAQWRQQHPQGALYLSYFGLADPAAYGLDYVNLPGGYYLGPQQRWPTDPGVLAISASNLQGIYINPSLRPWYSALAKVKPLQVLGGSIYLYAFPAPDIPLPAR